MGKAWLVGGLGAKNRGEAPAHSGYLVERWPLMVVPHSADIAPGSWADAPPAAVDEERPAAPYRRELWNAQSLETFVGDPESEWNTWSSARQLQLVKICLKIFFLPYYTVLDARAVAEAHALEQTQDAMPAPETVLPQPKPWAQEVEVAGLGLASFVVLRTPIEAGGMFLPKLDAEKVIRHPSNNSPIILEPRPEILDTTQQPPLVCGIEVDDSGVHRFVWPALLRWRPLADEYRPASDEELITLPADVAHACKATGVDWDIARELLAFLSAFGELEGGGRVIGEVAPELLAAEIVRNHPADPEVVPEGLTAAYLIRPFVWQVLAGLDAEQAKVQRKHLWLFDHEKLIDLFKEAERTSGGDQRKWSAAMQIWLRKQGQDIGVGLPCWVCIKDRETLGVDTDDWQALAADNHLVKRMYETYAHDYPFRKNKSVEVIAGQSGTEPAPS